MYIYQITEYLRLGITDVVRRWRHDYIKLTAADEEGRGVRKKS